MNLNNILVKGAGSVLAIGLLSACANAQVLISEGYISNSANLVNGTAIPNSAWLSPDNSATYDATGAPVAATPSFVAPGAANDYTYAASLATGLIAPGGSAALLNDGTVALQNDSPNESIYASNTSTVKRIVLDLGTVSNVDRVSVFSRYINNGVNGVLDRLQFSVYGSNSVLNADTNGTGTLIATAPNTSGLAGANTSGATEVNITGIASNYRYLALDFTPQSNFIPFIQEINVASAAPESSAATLFGAGLPILGVILAVRRRTKKA